MRTAIFLGGFGKKVKGIPRDPPPQGGLFDLKQANYTKVTKSYQVTKSSAISNLTSNHPIHIHIHPIFNQKSKHFYKRARKSIHIHTNPHIWVNYNDLTATEPWNDG